MDNFYSRDWLGKWIKYLSANDERNREEEIAYVKDVIYDPFPAFNVWVRVKEVDTSNNAKPWDFKNCIAKDVKFKPVWVQKLIDVESLESFFEIGQKKRICDPSTFDDPSLIVRASGDRSVSYGDGGCSDLVYPIWYCNQPKIDNELRIELLQSLLKLNESRKDYQEVTPVEDIIDPDLGPLRIPGNFVERKRAQLSQSTDPESKRELRDLNKDEPYFKISEMVKIRESYHWIPSIFHISEEGTVSIKSRIHNLPPKLSNADRYNQIAKIFEGMLPMFQKLHVALPNSDVQVIVKAQSYRLLPGMTYAGRWHVEGQTENIVAVGVYYLQVDEGLEGGKLKFRAADSPQPFYDIATDVELEVKQGSAVVFSNVVPHRFRKIVNTTNEEKRRTFLNFFIVDPSKPLKTTKENPSTSVLVKILSDAAAKHGLTLPKPIVKHIMSFMPNVWAGTTEAKKFRKLARDSMKSDRSGWGWINWGNCGTVEFVPAYSVWSIRRQDECRELQHTDSDNGVVQQ